MLVQCMDLKNGKVFTSKFVGTGPLSYEKRIYRAAVSQKFRNTVLGRYPYNTLLSFFHVEKFRMMETVMCPT